MPQSRSRSRLYNVARIGVALLLSLFLHAGALASLEHAAPLPALKLDKVVDIEIREPPKPAPTVLPPPEPPKPKVVQAMKVARIVPKELPPAPPHTPPPTAPPPTAPPPHPTAPVPVHIGVSMESTVGASDFAAAVGNSMYGAAPQVAPEPATASQPYWAPKYVKAYQVAQIPELLADFKADYPPQAKKDGIEGEVVMLLTIDQFGKVALVKKVSGPGHGLDEAAVGAAKKFKFKPATFHGEAVATEIRYVYSFEIE
jgi:periplasmic protein TonB